VLACAALFAAAPAWAGGEFRDGFEDQLGRLAALEVFHLGHVLLAGYPGPYYEGYYAPRYHQGHYAPRHRQHHRHHKHPGRHLGHHRRHHGAPSAIDHSRGLHRDRHGRLAVAERHVYRRHADRGRRGERGRH
jgi:hypothetical protein